MSGNTAVKLVDPPVTVPPLISSGSQQQFSQAWTEYNQSVSDLVNSLQQQVTALTAGVTDGSDAAAGQIGEYMSASGSAAMTSGTAATVASLSLTAGDWEVSGQVTINYTGLTGGNAFGANINGNSGTLIVVSVPNGASDWQLSAGAPQRFNVTAATTVSLMSIGYFSAGSVSATGTVQARRMR
jgi:hypothetical protein